MLGNKKNSRIESHIRWGKVKEKGQALVETVLVLPFLLILIIGIVEMGAVLNRQITVVNAAREGARFGAYGAELDSIYSQTLLATSQMFEFTEDNAVIIVIYAETNDAGDDFEKWGENRYPTGADVLHVTPDKVLEQLNEEGDASNLELVIVDVRYQHESLSGLPLLGDLFELVPIGSWTAMRMTVPNLGRRARCCVLPITLPVWDVEGLSIGDELVDIRVADSPGQFGWLFWDPDNNGNAVNLEVNLGNRCNVQQKFKDACDGSRKLTSGSWVSGASGEMPAVKDAVEELVGSYYPVPVWDRFELCGSEVCDSCKSGTKVAHIVGFALMEITEVHLSPGNPDLPSKPKTISAKFRGWYDGCSEQ